MSMTVNVPDDVARRLEAAAAARAVTVEELAAEVLTDHPVLIVDTGPLVAAADRTDRYHHACRELLETASGPLVTTAMVVAERLGATRIATLDRAHFSIVRPAHCDAFELSPIA